MTGWVGSHAQAQRRGGPRRPLCGSAALRETNRIGSGRHTIDEDFLGRDELRRARIELRETTTDLRVPGTLDLCQLIVGLVQADEQALRQLRALGGWKLQRLRLQLLQGKSHRDAPGR